MDFPKQLTLRPSRIRQVGLFFATVVLTVGGVLLTRDEGLFYVWVPILLGGGSCVLLYDLLTGRSRLILTPEGLTLVTWANSISQKWTDISCFSTTKLRGMPHVQVHYHEAYFQSPEYTKKAKWMRSSFLWLPAHFAKLSADELAGKLTEWKTRYGSS